MIQFHIVTVQKQGEPTAEPTMDVGSGVPAVRLAGVLVPQGMGMKGEGLLLARAGAVRAATSGPTLGVQLVLPLAELERGGFAGLGAGLPRLLDPGHGYLNVKG